MATEEELFAAVRTIRNHCKEQDEINPNSCVRDDYKCPLWLWCLKADGEKTPSQWPEP